MEEEGEGVIICYGSRHSPVDHVLVKGLTHDQEDELFHRVEEMYPPRTLMTDCLQTCEFWVEDVPLEQVRMAIETKLDEMNIPHKFQEGECY